MAEFHFRSSKAPHKKYDVNIHFLVGGLIFHFAGIFHFSFSVQKRFHRLYSVHSSIAASQRHRSIACASQSQRTRIAVAIGN
jgi:hypothetical protein